MSWLEKIRSKPQTEKLRLIKITLICSGLVLIVLWIFTSKIGRSSPKDTTLFQTIGRGIKDIRDNFKK